MSNKSYFWIIVSVIIVGVLVYLGLSGSLNLSSRQKSDQGDSQSTSPTVTVGNNLISPEGQVVDETGNPVRLDVLPGSPNAPRQSNPISPEILPADAVKLTVSASGFSPKSFTVAPGQVVTLALTANDNQTHIFKFRDDNLSAVAIGVGPGETRAIVFNAPMQTGDYSFYCDVPGHASRGETGVMTVK